MASASHQEGLRIIDDDEAAFEAADVALHGVQFNQSSPIYGMKVSSDAGALHQPPLQNTGHDDNDHSQMLETVRHAAKRLERQRQRYFFQELERK